MPDLSGPPVMGSVQPVPSFWSRVGTVLGGTFMAQLIPLLAAPLLTRLYGPAVLGVFSIWLGWVSIAAVVATLRFEVAIVLAATPEERRDGAATTMSSIAAMTVVGLAVAALAKGLGWLDGEAAGWGWLLGGGSAVAFTALHQLCQSHAVALGLFGPAARVKVAVAVAVVSLQLTLGALVGDSPAWLVAAQCVGLGVGAVLGVTWLRLPLEGLFRPGWVERCRAYMRLRRDFVRFSLPADLINTGASQLPLLLIGLHHGAAAAGLFALTQRVLGAPVALLAASVLDVFKQQASEDFRARGDCRPVYLHTLKVLTALAVVPVGAIAAFAPDLFEVVFGPEWREAGRIARLLAPLYLLRFIVSPLSYVLYIAGKQRIDLIWQATLLAVTLAALTVPQTLDAKLLAYSLGYGALYLVYLVIGYRVSRAGGGQA